MAIKYLTSTGHDFYLGKMTFEDICLEDIAHHLTKICRYGGAAPLDMHYSVAQHSLHLANFAKLEGYDVNTQKALLLHDASEAYLGDIVTGLKELLPDYKNIEKRVTDLINTKYLVYIDNDIQELITTLDHRILLDEAKVIMPKHFKIFKKVYKGLTPLNVPIHNENVIGLYSTYHLFLIKAYELGITDIDYDAISLSLESMR